MYNIRKKLMIQSEALEFFAVWFSVFSFFFENHVICIYFFSKTAFKPFHATGLFLYPLKHQKTSCFLMFSGGIERNQWHELGWIVWCRILLLIFWVVVCQDSTKKKKACQLLFSILEIFMRRSNIYKALQKRVKNLDPIFLPVEITDFFFFFLGGVGRCEWVNT